MNTELITLLNTLRNPRIQPHEVCINIRDRVDTYLEAVKMDFTRMLDFYNLNELTYIGYQEDYPIHDTFLQALLVKCMSIDKPMTFHDLMEAVYKFDTTHSAMGGWSLSQFIKSTNFTNYYSRFLTKKTIPEGVTFEELISIKGVMNKAHQFLQMMTQISVKEGLLVVDEGKCPTDGKLIRMKDFGTRPFDLKEYFFGDARYIHYATVLNSAYIDFILNELNCNNIVVQMVDGSVTYELHGEEVTVMTYMDMKAVKEHAIKTFSKYLYQLLLEVIQELQELGFDIITKQALDNKFIVTKPVEDKDI